MSNIKLLSEDIINKIAAGEVIERPASVVKELVENAIDAQATEIKVEIVSAGKRMIRISDNGLGMDRENAQMSLHRHATSKISTDTDLFSISTMGFRGEALSSIAGVSRMVLTTAPKGIVEGVAIEIEGGRIIGIKDKATMGTTIEVNDLFFNTPARKKFMKKNSTEQYHIVDILTRLALSHTDRQFSIYSDDAESMRLNVSSGVMERLSQIYGGEFIKKMKGFSVSNDIAHIEGYVSSGDNFRKSRSHQYIFVNKRPITDNSLRHAVYQAFGKIIPSGSHPIFFIYIEADTGSIDINVHPTKSEIRFSDRSSIYSLIVKGVNNTIGAKRMIENTISERQDITASRQIGIQINEPAAPISQTIEPQNPSSKFTYTLINNMPNRNYVYVGDVYAAYSYSDGLCIIDHHAAHERILYERIKSGIGLTSSRMLFPIQVRLSIKEHGVLKDYINKVPFIEIEDFGSDTFIIRSMPVEFNNADMVKILSDIAANLIDISSQSPIDEIMDIIAKKIACHSSVRGKKILQEAELDRLIKDLDNSLDPNHCPHGRPTRLYFSQLELGRMFKRNT
jgi:DNA mismatch repair protein MutL